MTAPEFSRPVQVDTLGEGERRLAIQGDEAERAALARRFGLVAIARLAGDLALSRKGGDVALRGTLRASVTQSCAATGDPVAAAIEAPFEILFRPKAEPPGCEDEVELSAGELDVVGYDGATIDAGEVVAETLALNLDTYPRAPGADAALKIAGVKSEEEAGPFAALAGLRDKLKDD